MSQILILDEELDNVGVVLADIGYGKTVSVWKNKVALTLKALDTIPAGHKIALARIEQDQPVMKYGSPIGRATQNIRKGELVHTHNLRSMRGKELLRERAGRDG